MCAALWSFASASPATRGALIATAGLAAAAVLGVLTVTIALIGLGRFSGDIDPTRVPGWLWYYRHDPELRRWLAVGLSCAGLVGGILIVAVLASGLAACGEKAQTVQPAMKKSDGKAWDGAQNAYVAGVLVDSGDVALDDAHALQQASQWPTLPAPPAKN